MMRQFRLTIGLMAVAVSTLFLVQASAQTKMTACVTKGGDSKNWSFGDQPLKPCSSNESQVTFVLQAGLDAQATSGAAAVAAETAARIAADGVLQGNINAEASARTAADGTLQANIDTEAAMRAAAVAAEASARAGADSGLQDQITANTNEITTDGGYTASRIDQGVAASNLAPVVFATGAGGHEDTSNFYRGGTYNPDTGDFKMYFDTNHGLDPLNGFWFCNIGDQVAQGDLLVALQTKVDDHTEVASKGFTFSSAHFAFKLKNLPGTTSPFKRVLVQPNGTGSYVEIFPTATLPLTAWIYGPRSTHSHGVGVTGEVFVAVSHAELEALCGCDIPNSSSLDNNNVLVDLNFTWTNVLKFEGGGDRGAHPSAADLIP